MKNLKSSIKEIEMKKEPSILELKAAQSTKGRRGPNLEGGGFQCGSACNGGGGK